MRGDLVDDLPALAAQAPAGATLVVFHTSVMYRASPPQREAFVASLLAARDSATTAAACGRALEDLIAYLVEQVPGIAVTTRNRVNAFEAEEIDVAFWNEGDPTGLRMFDHILLVECKNWSSPIGYPELAIFNDKL